MNRKNKILQYFNTTTNRELTRLTHTSTEQKFEVTVNFIGLNPLPIPTTTQIEHRTFLSPFVVTSLQITSTDEHPFGHQGGSTIFYNPISGLK